MSEAGSSHAQHVLSALNQQRALGRFCDATLNVGDGVAYLAHRNILACFSELFQQSNVPVAAEFCLQGCPSDGLELLLNFVYTGELKLDSHNLDRVQQAAASLCVPEALTLCQRFKETSVEPVPVKRKRGRPRKSASDINSVKEENFITVTKDEPSMYADSKVGVSITPVSRCLQVKELQIDDNVTSQVTGEVEAEEDNGDVGVLDEIPEDTDEEYVPTAKPASSAQSETSKNKNSQALEEDSKKDSVQCPVCLKSFKSKYYLKVHNRRHTGERPFGCLKCGKRYFRKENLLMHEMRDCTTVLFTCLTCSATFNGKEELRLHNVTHTGEMPHKCSTCPEQFMYKKNLTIHMMKAHGYPKPHACSQCPKTFLTRAELRVHEAAKHRGEKPYVCEECGHRASSRNGLQMHIKAIHRNERPFVCNTCGHAFSQKNNLKMHMRIHSGERPYQCHLCGKTFRTQASLDKHHRTHTGERPFGCDVCEQRFTEKGALLRHKASKHEDGRPICCCHICGKTFKVRGHLRVHLRRHKGMRKFECVDCGYKFTRQAHLRRHSQIHKRTENYNPRQRKLRNVIVQDVENDAPSEGSSLFSDGSHAAQQSTNQEAVSSAGLASGCIVRVVIESSDTVMEEVVSNQNLGEVNAPQTFPVPKVLQETQLVTEPYESTMDMEGIVENLSESKT
uniref:Zinc finger and BTB domain containing 48 n=1 Tax=Amphilophus citrinellus TaxID=61819 RepID=A0A3Q0SJI7_AMPCI